MDQLSDLFWHNLFRDYLSDIRTTGSLVPTNTLRHRSSRHRLLFASQVSGRLFTEGIVKDALQKVMTDHAVELPSTPGFTLDCWLDTTASSLSKLLQRARRSTVAMDCNRDR